LENPSVIGYSEERIDHDYIDEEYIIKNPIEWEIIKIICRITVFNSK
jgi:hypothetical protein